MKALAVIGGTGVSDLPGLEIADAYTVVTPYGEPSGVIQYGRRGEAGVFFLQRHGNSKAIPPHRINYRANMWALQSLGVTDVVAINAVGGISASMRPGSLVIPDQLIDYTWGREHTVDTGGDAGLMHIDFSQPYDQTLRKALLGVAGDSGIAYQAIATHAVTQGPRLESAAEIKRLANDGCDVVGMTGMPEASLAREMGLAYASVCMVVNPAAGLSDEPITLSMMKSTLKSEAAVVSQLLSGLIAVHY